MSRADQLVQQGDYVKASDELSDAIIKASNLSILHRKQAEVLRHLGDPVGADRELKKAADLDKPKSVSQAPSSASPASSAPAEVTPATVQPILAQPRKK